MIKLFVQNAKKQDKEVFRLQEYNNNHILDLL